MLKYNGKQVEFRAEIVDGEGPVWMAADDFGDYRHTFLLKSGVADYGPFPEQPDQYVLLTPRLPTLKLRQVIEATGIYDAEMNLVRLKNVRVVGTRSTPVVDESSGGELGQSAPTAAGPPYGAVSPAPDVPPRQPNDYEQPREGGDGQ